jgi:hypothetical protein
MIYSQWKQGRLMGAMLFAGAMAWGQPVGFGIVGGVPLTDGLSDFTQSGPGLVTRTFSNSKLYTVGAMVEVRLPLGLSVEADGLYRPVNYSIDTQVTGGLLYHSSADVTTWEFPVLAKYRFKALPIVHPFVEAGPSFRAAGSELHWLSSEGFTAGGGVEIKILKLRISPQVRYTHWNSDAAQTLGTGFPPSNQNQAEFLVGLSF